MVLLVSAVREELGAHPGEPLGVGPVVSAARMATVLRERQPAAVVMVGTAGAYQGGPAVGTAVVAERVGLSEGVAAMGLGYVPRAPQPISCDSKLLARLDGPRVSVLTVSAITTDSVLAGRLSDGWQVEQMEAYGAAVACAQAGVPFAAVYGISNVVGPDAHTQWLAYRHEAQLRALAVVAPLLNGGSK